MINVDWSNLQQVLQFVLKIATVGLSGATYMIVYWKTRNLLGVAIVHFLNDLLPSVLDVIFVWKGASAPADTSYVTGDLGTTVVYAFQLVFDLVIFIWVYKKVWPQIDKEKTLREW